IAGSTIEDELVEMKRKRAKKLKASARPAARKVSKDGDGRKRAEDFLRSGDREFDAGRVGLAPRTFGMLIGRRYIEFRTGAKPTARELAALLRAGLVASGRPQEIDHDLLRRNLQNYERRHPHPLASGERCAQIIEVADPPKAT